VVLPLLPEICSKRHRRAAKHTYNRDHYCKSFNRMRGQMRYVTADNKDFLLALVRGLEGYTDECAV
jgi:hypothetical protein